MDENKGKIIENKMSGGMRTVHVVMMDIDPDANYWSERVAAPESWKAVKTRKWLEKELGMHHLEVTWPAREMIRIYSPRAVGDAQAEKREKVRAAMWWIGERASGLLASMAVDFGATLYRMAVGCWPTRAYIRRMPEDIGESPLAKREGDDLVIQARDASGETEVRMEEWKDLPYGFVVVM